MKIALTKVEVIVGKDKREWLKVYGFSLDGTTVEGMLPKPEVLPTVDIDVSEFNAGTEVDFDQRGRMVSVTQAV